MIEFNEGEKAPFRKTRNLYSRAFTQAAYHTGVGLILCAYVILYNHVYNLPYIRKIFEDRSVLRIDFQG